MPFTKERENVRSSILRQLECVLYPILVVEEGSPAEREDNLRRVKEAALAAWDSFAKSGAV